MDIRLKKLRALMKKKNFDAVFVSSVPNITYLTGFSGFGAEDRDAFLFITKKGQYVFTHGIYKDAAEKYIQNFQLIEMKREQPVSKSLKKIIAKYKIHAVAFEGFDLKVDEYGRLLKFIKKSILKSDDLVGQLRVIKSSDEILAIKRACSLGDQTYSQILKNIRIGITEKELAFAIDSLIRENGAVPSFPTIVAFGSNASFPHHVAAGKKLEKNMFVLMDFGAKLDSYCSDMTRTVFFGKANENQVKVYNTVFESQQQAISYITTRLQKKQNVEGKNADGKAREYIIAQSFPTIPHSLGHGIGLEVHELPHISPVTNDALEEGMVFSIEPGIYLPGKFGVRIEDLFAIEKGKLTPLSRSPKRLAEIG